MSTQTTEERNVSPAPDPSLATATTAGPTHLIVHDLLACALITVLWIAPVFVIGLEGEFPLNDDWAYAKPVHTFFETGQLSRTEWTHMPIVTHTAIGIAFVKLFGDSFESVGQSFESLRLAGFVMGWAGLIGTYVLCRQISAGIRWSIFAALIVGFNPIYFNLSYTFMTDIPFTALCVWSLVLLTRGFMTGRLIWFVIGMVVALLATLTRQFGLAIPIGFSAALVISRPKRALSWLIALALPVVVLLAYSAATWLAYRGDRHELESNFYLVHHVAVKIWEHLLYKILAQGTYHWLYFGLCLSPVAVLLASVYGRWRSWVGWCAAAVTLLIIAAMLKMGWRLPGFNIIHNLGLGARETIPGYTLLPKTPLWVWWVISIMSVGSASCIVAVTLDHFRTQWTAIRKSQIILLLAAVIGAYMTIVVTRHFDRYLLPILPMVAAVMLCPLLASKRLPRRALYGAIAIMLVLATYSILGTHDYLVRHRNRWTLLTDLMNEGVAAKTIQGGFEFNRWYGLDKYNPVEYKVPGEFLWVFNDDDEYVVSYASAVDGYKVYKEREYYRLLPPGTEQIRLFQRYSHISAAADAEPRVGP